MNGSRFEVVMKLLRLCDVIRSLFDDNFHEITFHEITFCETAFYEVTVNEITFYEMAFFGSICMNVFYVMLDIT